MTDEQVIEKAKKIAEDNDWLFKGEVHIQRTRKLWLVGRKIIRVMSNKGYRGINVFITFCAETGEVLHKGFGKR